MKLGHPFKFSTSLDNRLYW